MLMELVRTLRSLGEYGELETFKPGDHAEAGAAVGASGVGVVSIDSFLVIFFIFTGENGLVCSLCPDGRIWASGTMVEAAPAPAVRVGSAPEKWRLLGWLNC